MENAAFPVFYHEVPILNEPNTFGKAVLVGAVTPLTALMVETEADLGIRLAENKPSRSAVECSNHTPKDSYLIVIGCPGLIPVRHRGLSSLVSRKQVCRVDGDKSCTIVLRDHSHVIGAADSLRFDTIP